jgi:hypothetical protein
MLWTTRLLTFAYLALRFFLPCPLFAQTPPPIQAELLQRLNAAKVKVGDPVLAKVLFPWKNSICELRVGAIIQGRVVAQQAHSKTKKTSEISISFESGQCGGREMKPLFLTVAAVVSPSLSGYPDSHLSEDEQPLSSAIGLLANGSVRSVSQAAATVHAEPRVVQAPHSVTTGQVLGIPHLAISVGQGPDGASILRSTGRNVQLSPGTELVLVPNPKSDGDPSADAKNTTPATAPNGSVPAVLDLPTSTLADETEPCVAPDCTIALPAGQFDSETHGAQTTLPLKNFGYLPAPLEKEMSSLDYDAGIAYLGPDQLLVTFNLHTLVHRSAADALSSRGLRIVRAVLIDLQTKKVMKTLDWRVPDSGRYFWPVGVDQLLVHVGQELRVYGPGLVQSEKISLGGPLAFVQVSPASDFFAVGITHERHTRQIHQQLEEAEARDPEEEIEIRLLNSRFRPLTTIMRSSRLPPPVLLNNGEVQVRGVGRNRWQFVESTWTGERRILAAANSTCTPRAESVPGNLLFVLGCGAGETRWYRVLHEDGKVLLKGLSFSSELGQTAGGNVGRNAFAIRIAEATTSRSRLSAFKPADLQSSHVTVYRAKNGRRIFSIGLPDLAPAVQTFAISPRENQMAFLKSDEVAFYQLSVSE